MDAANILKILGWLAPIGRASTWMSSGLDSGRCATSRSRSRDYVRGYDWCGARAARSYGVIAAVAGIKRGVDQLVGVRLRPGCGLVADPVGDRRLRSAMAILVWLAWPRPHRTRTGLAIGLARRDAPAISGGSAPVILRSRQLTLCERFRCGAPHASVGGPLLYAGEMIAELYLHRLLDSYSYGETYTGFYSLISKNKPSMAKSGDNL